MGRVWDQDDWRTLDRETSARARGAPSDTAARALIARRSRQVLRAFSTSFFLVTRFLPPAKRAQVEIIYSAVRYPDEVVDSFPIDPPERLRLLREWAEAYDAALSCEGVREALKRGVPPFLAAFADVVRARAIPPRLYRDFLEAMRLDVAPRPYRNFDDLVESYVYGSAIVVGYFLAYVYGPGTPDSFPRTLASSRALGIALQLTNFLRDVREDQRRGRVYLPQDLLVREGVPSFDLDRPGDRLAVNRVLREVSSAAERFYVQAARDLDAFAPDSRAAIQACIDVYGRLNQRIGRSAEGVLHRESVPLSEKFRVLPRSKYWRLPLAYLGGI